MDHGGELARSFSLPTLRPSAIAVVHVPIPSLGHDESLRGWQAERGDIAHKHQEACERLAALRDAKFSRLLDSVSRVPASIRKTNHLRPRASIQRNSFRLAWLRD
jgi:hypothetical protein